MRLDGIPTACGGEPPIELQIRPPCASSWAARRFSVSTLWSRTIDFCCYARAFEARLMRPARLLALLQ